MSLSATESGRHAPSDATQAMLRARSGQQGDAQPADVAAVATVAAGPPRLMSFVAWRSVVLLTLTTLFVFADQNLMAPNLSAIAKEFGFTDAQRDEKLGGARETPTHSTPGVHTLTCRV